ncbi:MAG: acyltransferase family protein [Bacteroides sp.]|nr:acyltransferase family protein [Prevotella sp.]MCM1408571.1 acyltransferase family protein [Treponema brennaborense]MCM1468940.1 acyltransferase family protein [Bacteroides sp.]
MRGGVCIESPVNGALWTIKIEAAFYIVLPLVVFVIDKIRSRRGKNIFLSCCYVFSVLWNVSFSRLGQIKSLPFLSDMAHQFPGFVSYFASGMLCIYNWKFLQRNLNKMIVPALVIFLLHYFTRTEIFMPFTLTVCVMWFGIVFERLSFIGEKSDFSYGMYLTHFPIIQFCVALGYFEQMPFFTFQLVVCASFAMSYLMNCATAKKRM